MKTYLSMNRWALLVTAFAMMGCGSSSSSSATAGAAGSSSQAGSAGQAGAGGTSSAGQAGSSGAGASGTAGTAGSASSLPSCTESWCHDVQPYCHALVGACVTSAGMSKTDAESTCIDMMGLLLRDGGLSVSSAIEEIQQCSSSATSCGALRECQRAAVPRHGCPEHWPGDGAAFEKLAPTVCSYEMPTGCTVSCTKSEEGTWTCPVPVGASFAECSGSPFATCASSVSEWTANNDPAVRCEGKLDAAEETVAADTVIAEGDVPSCVSCAQQHCASESSLCFVDAFSTPGCFANGDVENGSPDCCATYRTCVAMCQEINDDPSQLALCVATSCDDDMPNGKAQFQPYAACMASACAGCL
ncbi:MAG: hypothetical protein U0165_11225 [Polyangiaceae bacterium]